MSAIQIEHVKRVPVARPRDDIDVANAAAVRAELVSLVADGADRLVVDLSGIRYLDSAGIDMLFGLAERLRQRRAQLLVVIPSSSQLARLAEIVALGDAMALHETVEGALAAAAAEPPAR